jgi:AraC-like DNA-binding protein
MPKRRVFNHFRKIVSAHNQDFTVFHGHKPIVIPMKVILPPEIKLNIEHELSEPEFRKLKLDYGAALKVEAPFGTILIQKFEGTDFELGYQHLFSAEPTTIKIGFEKPLLMLSYLLDGEVAYLKEGEPETTAVRNGSYHLCYEAMGEHPLHLGKGYVENFFIILSDAYLTKLGTASAQIEALLQAVRIKSHQPLHTPFYKITARIRKAIREVTSYRGMHPELFISAKINELLLLYLNSVHTKDFPEPIFTLDKEKLTALTAYIMVSVEQPLTVEILARKFGYSVNVLHKKFKRSYGISLYKYIQEQRLFKARQLLTGEKYYSVGQIGSMCGYDDPANFCTAFKKRFGHATSYYRMAGKTLR